MACFTVIFFLAAENHVVEDKLKPESRSAGCRDTCVAKQEIRYLDNLVSPPSRFERLNSSRRSTATSGALFLRG